MDRNQVRFALLKISFAVLAGTTWLFSSFIFATRPEEQGADALSTLVRLPASLPAQLPEALPNLLSSTTKPLPPIRMDAMALRCWDRSETKEHLTPSRWIRLTGKPCQPESSAEHVRVQNLANGYVATVFTQGAADLTTDFIPLESGKNEIIIRFETEPGTQIENKFTLLRE